MIGRYQRRPQTRDFLRRYAANPLNRMSGTEVHRIQRMCRNQAEMEAMGLRILEERRKYRFKWAME